MKPNAPALATAVTNGGRPTPVMPPMTMGASTPNISVIRVVINVASLPIAAQYAALARDARDNHLRHMRPTSPLARVRKTPISINTTEAGGGSNRRPPDVPAVL